MMARAGKKARREPIRTTAPPWALPPERLELQPSEVHVWRATVHSTPSRLTALRQILSEDERSRADRIKVLENQNRFIVARGLLRTVLGRCMAVEPAALRFTYGPQGKPALADTSGQMPVQFNLAHSGDLALYAMTIGRRIGVDVERFRGDVTEERIAKRFFSAAEVAALRAIPDRFKSQAFFNCWTRKEAYIKAMGAAIGQSLNTFDVSLTPGEPAALLRTHGNPGEADRWSLQELDVGPGYAAALAVEGHGWRLRCWQWPGSSEL